MRILAKWFKDSVGATLNEGFIVRENIDNQLTGYRYDGLGLIYLDKNNNKILDASDLAIGSIIDTQTGASGQLLQDLSNSSLYAIRSDQSVSGSSGLAVIFDADFNSGKPVVPPAPVVVVPAKTNASSTPSVAIASNNTGPFSDTINTKTPADKSGSSSSGPIVLKNPPALMPKAGTKDYEDLLTETKGASAKPGFNYVDYIAVTRRAQKVSSYAVIENIYANDKVTGLLADGSSLGKSKDAYRFYNLGSGRLGIGEKSSQAINEITLANTLVFSDNRVDLNSEITPIFARLSSLDGPEAKIFRLYNSAFNRFPDLTGFDYWINSLASNHVAFMSIANNFILSAEFSQKYGLNTTNQIFTQNLYSNILGRLPDSEGLSYWISTLDNRINSRADVLAYFSESSENKQIFAQTTGLF